jgi:hypothetical protein
MLRHSFSTDAQLLWVEVSVAEPCRICGATRECTTVESGEFARCINTVSERPVLDGGWLHRLDQITMQADILTPV